MSYHSLWQSLLPLYDAREAQSIARLVLDEKFGLSLTDIVCGGVDNLSGQQQTELQNIMQRLQQGEPVQYVLGYAYFYGRKFNVAPGVLIPRPETEQLCNIIIQNSKSNIQNSQRKSEDNHKPQTSNLKSQILDIGTGSGCIAITLAKEMPDAKVYALDISDEALQIAKGNAKALDANVTFIKQDILDKNTDGLGNSFSLIVSNPPYITLRERSDMAENVLEHEPSQALFVPDDDPLLFYRAIGKFAIKHLTADGSLYFEINPLFVDELKAMLKGLGFTHVDIIDDDFGKQRFAWATNIPREYPTRQ